MRPMAIQQQDLHWSMAHQKGYKDEQKESSSQTSGRDKPRELAKQKNKNTKKYKMKQNQKHQKMIHGAMH